MAKKRKALVNQRHDDRRMYELHLAGYTLHQIADRFQTDYRLVHAAINRAEREDREIAFHRRDQLRHQQVRRLESLYRLALDGFVRSRIVEDPDGNGPGNPAFLGVARMVLKDIRDIFGIDAPKHVQLDIASKIEDLKALDVWEQLPEQLRTECELVVAEQGVSE